MNDEVAHGDKLPPKYDDPVDIYFKKMIDIINPSFKKWGFTPNMITTLSFAAGLTAAYAYYKQFYVISSILILVSYFFDVMDGYFARIYDMKSEFGSYYDVISDNVVWIIFIYLFFTNKHIIQTKIISINIIVTVMLIALTWMQGYHLSCQEKYTAITNKQHVSSGLSFLQSIPCENTSIMKYTRFYAAGPMNVYISLLILSHIFFTKK